MSTSYFVELRDGIARTVRANLAAPDALARLSGLARLAADIANGKRKVLAETGVPQPTPCPLLLDDVCRVYAFRPMVCRGMTSFDRNACAVRSGAEGYLHDERVARAVMDGIRQGTAAAGLSGGRLDLAPALVIVLTEPDAAARWLRGEPVFTEAETLLRG